MKKQYVTYGFNEFDQNKFLINKEETIYASCGHKPLHAWWGSPTNAEFGWKEWCENEDWIPKEESMEEYFADNNKVVWELTKNCKILYIENFTDLFKIPLNSNEWGYFIDFDQLRKNGYSGMEVCMDKYYFGHIFSANEQIFDELNKLDPENIEELYKKAMKIQDLLYGWDCDSICIWDKEAIIPIERTIDKDKIR